VLHRLSNEPGAAAAYTADPDAFLARFRLEPEERALLATMDVEALAARGLNWMLLMGAYQGLHGRAKNREYLDRIAAHRTQNVEGAR
jgi:hypothetical protein